MPIRRYTADAMKAVVRLAILQLALSVCLPAAAQTQASGPWWPSAHGAGDQAGASNYVTPQEILEALQLPRTGQTYELGHPYEASMPQFTSRPY